MLSLRQVITVGLFLAALLAGAIYPNAASAGAGNVAAFTKGHPGDHRSPDGKYVAHLTIGEGETGMLTVYRRGSRRSSTGAIVLRPVRDVDAAVWVPGRSHALAFGASGTYGIAMLGLWNGGRPKRLVRVSDPTGVSFQVSGTSRDGHTLLYRRGEDTSKGFVWHRHRLRIPPE